ncbi:MAG: chorismate mutase [Pseudomonadota bacterium]
MTERLKTAEECVTREDVRHEIDRIDDAVVDLLAERWQYVDRMWQIKNNAAEAVVPWRIQVVIDRVRARAEEKDMPAELAEALWRQIIGWAIQYEEEKLRAREGEGS